MSANAETEGQARELRRLVAEEKLGEEFTTRSLGACGWLEASDGEVRVWLDRHGAPLRRKAMERLGGRRRPSGSESGQRLTNVVDSALGRDRESGRSRWRLEA